MDAYTLVQTALQARRDCAEAKVIVLGGVGGGEVVTNIIRAGAARVIVVAQEFSVDWRFRHSSHALWNVTAYEMHPLDFLDLASEDPWQPRGERDSYVNEKVTLTVFTPDPMFADEDVREACLAFARDLGGIVAAQTADGFKIIEDA